MHPQAELTGDSTLGEPDLGPLAWVLDELRKSLDGAIKALRRFVRDAELSRGSDLGALDASQLRIARQQLHQAVGALEMVGLEVPARMLRAMEALAQKFVQRPEICSDEAALKLERASFALTDYLDGLLKGKESSAVALFPQYRDVLDLAGDDRVHPADLWSYDWHWHDVTVPKSVVPLSYDSTVRSRIDGHILNVVKSAYAPSARAMCDISLGFAAAQTALHPRVFWAISAAYFEAVALGLCASDIYTKRAASRILLQYRTLARGEPDVSERLVQDLLFFCAQAALPKAQDAPALNAVRQAYGLMPIAHIDYEKPQFGRFDPAMLAQARKRIAAATETWSSLSGGESHRIQVAVDQFSLVSDSIVKLHPDSAELAAALTRALEAVARSGKAPAPALAMEVATAVLYLEAAYEDMGPTSEEMVERSRRLAQRLDHVIAGGQPEPLDTWMEELYRRVSDRQIMGSVVDELRTTLGEVETSLDAFFRRPADKLPLQEVPGRLAQMRGVFSVLGLDQAALAALRMRDQVEHCLADDFDVAASSAVIFEKLGNSLGAMGFLIDMLSYQRELAKKLFVYDEAQGEFRSLMGRQKAAAAEAVETPLPELVPEAVAAVEEVAEVEEDDDDAELRSIFIEEAREVVGSGLAAIAALQGNRTDPDHQTGLRRAFHTLKGSSRMVGLTEFGEAAWSLEQVLNAWLPQQQPASDELLKLTGQAMDGFGRWIEDIANGCDADWRAEPFRQAADRLRLDNVGADIVLPDQALPATAPEVLAPPVPVADLTVTEALLEPLVDDISRPDFSATQIVDFDDTQMHDFGDLPVTEDLLDLSFADLAPVESAEPVVPESALIESALIEPESVMPDILPLPEAIPEPEPDEPVKVIGSLQIGLALYNVYLNEADEWSRRLLTELTEWSLELDQPVNDTTIGLAHSLAGSSATVGFMGLSELARALEHALEHVQLGGVGLPEHAQLFVQVAEDIRRLLHQFAAGFFKHPDPEQLAALRAVLETPWALPAVGQALPEEFPEPILMPEPEPELPAPQPLFAEVKQPVASVAQDALEDEEIEAIDTLDVDLFEIFEEEALELLPQLSGALRHWIARPDNLGARQEVLRVLHTLKGSARLAGAMRLGEMAHRMESAAQHFDVETTTSAQLEPLLARLDGITRCFEDLRATPVSALALPEAPLQVRAVLEQEASPVSAGLTPALPQRRSIGQTVRVKSQLLDRMVNQAGEVMITRTRLESRLGQLRGVLGELTGNLDRLRHQLRDIQLQSESQMQSRLAQTKETEQGFDPLEFDRFTRVQELTRMMAESVDDVATLRRNLQQTIEGVEDDLIAQARQTRELQRDLLRTRMVEFDSISERLYGVVRQAAKDFDRQVKLDIVGGSLEMDRGVLERMAPAFEHLLRNAVGHGIEPTEARVAAGKPPAGVIRIALEQQSNDVVVTFSDDGAGLDLSSIREKALAQGQIKADQVVSDDELANLIFTSGLSTAKLVSEMAGRGIGMDVVRNEVSTLGGRIELQTQHGQGTQFKLVLPLTTAVTHVVSLRIGDVVIGVSSNLVELVRRVPAPEVDAAYRLGRFEYNGIDLPFYWAGALLQTSPVSSEAKGKSSTVAIFRSAGQRVAVHVDEVLGNQEVVVKNLGPQLSRLPALTGMSVLASGAVMLIYNPVTLATIYGEQAGAFSRPQSPANAVLAGHTGVATGKKPHQLPLILVVDDSITVRRVTQRLLKREGFRVALAADGLQALEMLQTEKPSVVLSDIEMPRMDGFDLVRNIRADVALRDLPVIMITSRMAEKHREYARELKVDHYLGKPYSEEELIGLVRAYCSEELSA